MTEDQAMTQLIDERDAAENAMSRAYEMVMGEAPQWSNMFGYTDALDQMRWKMEGQAL